MTDIYALHDKAFARVSAFVILNKEGERVATVALKFPADGAGRLYAYCHLIGLPMQRHYAGGFGYDKRSPAVRGAFLKSKPVKSTDVASRDTAHAAMLNGRLQRINEALAGSDGEYWDRLLEKAGFRVLQAV